MVSIPYLIIGNIFCFWGTQHVTEFLLRSYRTTRSVLSHGFRPLAIAHGTLQVFEPFNHNMPTCLPRTTSGTPLIVRDSRSHVDVLRCTATTSCPRQQKNKRSALSGHTRIHRRFHSAFYPACTMQRPITARQRKTRRRIIICQTTPTRQHCEQVCSNVRDKCMSSWSLVCAS
jgi:hypothetical protein